MTPSRSRRFSRSCTALRDRPRWRPNAAVGIRAFARSKEIKRRSVSSKLRFAIIPRRFAGPSPLFSPFAGLRQAGGDRATTHAIDVSDRAALIKVARGQDAVLSALPFFLNPGVAELCAE